MGAIPTFSEEQRHEICRILESFDIPPGDIPEDSLDKDGFESVITRPDGTWLTIDGRLQTDWHPWPDGCWEEIERVLKNG